VTDHLDRRFAETNPAALLAELRAWGTPDMIWENYDGERMWFKQMPPEPPHLPGGYRTECCFADGNVRVSGGGICRRHRAMAGLPPPTWREHVWVWWNLTSSRIALALHIDGLLGWRER